MDEGILDQGEEERSLTIPIDVQWRILEFRERKIEPCGREESSADLRILPQQYTVVTAERIPTRDTAGGWKKKKVCK